MAASALLEVQWRDRIDRIRFDLLRSMCPCAPCEARRRRGERIPGADVSLVEMEAFGANAVLLKFSDGHGRGIFPFSYLHMLAAGAPGEPER